MGQAFLPAVESVSGDILVPRTDSSPLGGSEYASALADSRQTGMSAPPNAMPSLGYGTPGKMGTLCRQERPAAWPMAVTALAVICIALRAPRYAGSVRRDAGSYLPTNQVFTLRQTDRLVSAMGSEPVEVDIPSLTHLLFVVIEIGHRTGVNLQWTPESFHAAFAYTHWPPPAYPPAQRRLVMATEPVPPGWHVTFRAFPYFLITRQQSPR